MMHKLFLCLTFFCVQILSAQSISTQLKEKLSGASDQCERLEGEIALVEYYYYVNIDSIQVYVDRAYTSLEHCKSVGSLAIILGAQIHVDLLREDLDKAKVKLNKLGELNKENADYKVNQLYNYFSSKYYLDLNDLDSARLFIKDALRFSSGSDYEPLLKLQAAYVDYQGKDYINAYGQFMDVLRLYDQHKYGAVIDVQAQLYAVKIYAIINERELTEHLLLAAKEMCFGKFLLLAPVSAELAQLYLQQGLLDESRALLSSSTEVLVENQLPTVDNRLLLANIELYTTNINRTQSIVLELENSIYDLNNVQLAKLESLKAELFVRKKKIYEAIAAYKKSMNQYQMEELLHSELLVYKKLLSLLDAVNSPEYDAFYRKFLEKERSFHATKLPLEIRSLEADYNLSLADRELTELEEVYKRTQRESTMLRALLFVAFLLVLLLVMLVKLTMKRNKEKVELEAIKVQQQKLIIENKSLINAKAQVDVHKFSQEILELTKATSFSKDIISLIKRYNMYEKIDAEWKEFINAAYDTNATLVTNLAEHGIQLSKSEIRLSALLLKGLSSSQIASILSIQVSSVEKARSRLRKKIYLEPGADLLEGLKKYQ